MDILVLEAPLKKILAVRLLVVSSIPPSPLFLTLCSYFRSLLPPSLPLSLHPSFPPPLLPSFSPSLPPSLTLPPPLLPSLTHSHSLSPTPPPSLPPSLPPSRLLPGSQGEQTRFNINPLLDANIRALMSQVYVEGMMAGIVSRTMSSKSHGPNITVERITAE